MDLLEKSHVALRGDVNSIKNQIDKIVEAMIILAKREDNIQWTAVIEDVIPPQVNDLARPQPVRVSVENSTVQEYYTVQDGCFSYHNVIEYHDFSFSTPNSQGASLAVNTEHPQDVEITKRCRVMEKRLKAI